MKAKNDGRLVRNIEVDLSKKKRGLYYVEKV